jgi:hypothetical protein
MQEPGPKLHQIRVADLGPLRMRVSALGMGDTDCTERLLGQLAGLEASNAGRAADETVFFVPMRGCRELADRAVAQLDAGQRYDDGRWAVRDAANVRRFR